MFRYWTKEEDEILINYYPKEGTGVIKRLKDRTINAIKNRAQALGIIYRYEMINWTAEELEILKIYYPTEGKKVAIRLPRRTVKTIQATALRLGIKRIFRMSSKESDDINENKNYSF